MGTMYDPEEGRGEIGLNGFGVGLYGAGGTIGGGRSWTDSRRMDLLPLVCEPSSLRRCVSSRRREGEALSVRDPDEEEEAPVRGGPSRRDFSLDNRFSSVSKSTLLIRPPFSFFKRRFSLLLSASDSFSLRFFSSSCLIFSYAASRASWTAPSSCLWLWICWRLKGWSSSGDVPSDARSLALLLPTPESLLLRWDDFPPLVPRS